MENKEYCFRGAKHDCYVCEGKNFSDKEYCFWGALGGKYEGSGVVTFKSKYGYICLNCLIDKIDKILDKEDKLNEKI